MTGGSGAPGYLPLPNGDDVRRRPFEPMQVGEPCDEDAPSPVDACVDVCRLRVTRVLVAAAACVAALQGLTRVGASVGTIKIRCLTGEEDFPTELLPRGQQALPARAMVYLNYNWRRYEFTSRFKIDSVGAARKGEDGDFPSGRSSFDNGGYGYSTFWRSSFDRMPAPEIDPKAAAGTNGTNSTTAAAEPLGTAPLAADSLVLRGRRRQERPDPWVNGTRVPFQVYQLAVGTTAFARRAWPRAPLSGAARVWGCSLLTTLWLTAIGGVTAMLVAFLTVVGKGGGVRLHRTSKMLLRGSVYVSVALAAALATTSCWLFPAAVDASIAERMGAETLSRLQHVVDKQVTKAVTLNKWAAAPSYPPWQECVPAGVETDVGYWWTAGAAAILAAHAGVCYVALTAPGRSQSGGARATTWVP